MLKEIIEKAKRISVSYAEAEHVIRDAIESAPPMPGCRFLAVEEPYMLYVIGDVHGDWDTLRCIASRIDESVERRGLGKEDYLVVFLGDYIDRGEYQLETLLSVALARLELDNVVTLRGNHEPPRGLEPYPHDFPYILFSRLGPQKARRLYALCMEFFDTLPLAVKVGDTVILMHGGPPVEVKSEGKSIHELLRCPEGPPPASIVEQILWNDPTEEVDEWLPSPRGAGYVWGPMVTEAVLTREDVKAIIRAHEPCHIGYKFNHDGRVLTLFSCILPHYGNRAAGYLELAEPWRLREEGLYVLRKGVRTVESTTC